MADLLPINATKQERDLSNSIARIENIPVDIRDLWNPDKCPVVFLPWLAWSLSVDLWKDSWPEETKRAVIKASIEIHSHKGTPWAVEKYMEAIGITAEVLEWFEYNGDPYKFKVRTSNRMSNADYYEVIEAVNVSKNTRSHLDAIQVPCDMEGAVGISGLPLLGISITASMSHDVNLKQAQTFTAAQARIGISITSTLASPEISSEPELIYSTCLVRLGNSINGVIQ